MTMISHGNPAASNTQEGDSSPISESLDVGFSTAEKKQASLMGSGEGPMKIRVKEVS
jgi:hypothetical protein